MAGVRIGNGWLKRLRRSELMALPLAVSLASMLGPAALAAPAKTVCTGTLLQLAVQEQAVSDIDRFRFSLGLSGEGATEAVALQQLNQRLKQLRHDLMPLIVGQLTVPAPRSHQQGRSDDKRFVARTTLSGEVSRDNYDALIQAAGRLPGVRQRGMTSLASRDSHASLADQLLKQALETGQRRAQATARALGLRKVELLLIDQRGSTQRPMQMAARKESTSFRPGEAPKPSQSLTLKLDYCLR